MEDRTMAKIRKIFEHAQELSGRMIVRGVNIGPLPVNEAMALVIRTLDEERDRIEELEAKLARAVLALQLIEGLADTHDQRVVAEEMLAELKGQNDD
jgi:hypothetical protein